MSKPGVAEEMTHLLTPYQLALEVKDVAHICKHLASFYCISGTDETISLGIIVYHSISPFDSGRLSQPGLF